MKLFCLKFKSVTLIVIFVLISNVSFSKESNVQLLKPDWSFNGFLVNLIELPFKEVIKSTKKCVPLVTQ